MMNYIIWMIIGYCIGCIPFSYLIPKIFLGIDIMTASQDHNPGTSNAMKYAGIPVGCVCLFCDMAKGFIPIYLCARLCDVNNLYFALVMAAPVLGHCFSAFFKFKGGKAVAVSFGVLIALMWDTLIVFGLVFWYLLTVALPFLRPNEKKSVVAFLSFSVTMIVCGMFYQLPVSICTGCLIFSAAATYRNGLDLSRRKRNVSAETETAEKRDAVQTAVE